MSPPVDRIPSDEKLPARADVVIIGGGIIGVCTALELARKGLSVAIVEKGHVAAEQSSRNWGWCRVHGRAIPDLPLSTTSLRLWSGMDKAIGRATGFTHCGMLAVLHDESELAFWDDWFEQARPFQMDGRVLTREELRALVPEATGADWVAGVYSPSDGRAEPLKAAPAIAEGARDRGVTIHQNCAARGLETTGGRVSAVVTEKGTIRTSAALCAGGAWASMFCRHHGIPFPQAGVHATAWRTEKGPNITDGGINDGIYALRRRDDGGYTIAHGGAGRVDITPQSLRYAPRFLKLFLKRRKKLTFGIGSSFFNGPESWATWRNEEISPFEKMRVYDPAPSTKLIEKGMEFLRRDYPVMKDVKVADSWGGFIDSTPDSRPVISPIASLPGFYLAAGFSGLGFGMGPAAGRLAADLIANDVPIIDPTPYRHARFTDGTRMDPSARLG
ncbi:FAD-binding oxidoreductase [Acetobacteraceae bacterium H6797]|nr:FAD-binding oxidoreductase [Acetobacteraceae bacterium H6797]